MLSRFTSLALTALLMPLLETTTAFTTSLSSPRRSPTRLAGYLDDLSKELYAPDGSSSREEIDTDKMKMDKDQIDRYGVGSWDDYVEFEEFDGGDGQMGVAGDGESKACGGTSCFVRDCNQVGLDKSYGTTCVQGKCH